MAFAFVEFGDLFQVHLVLGCNVSKHMLHACVKIFGEKDVVIAATVDNVGRYMPRHGRPVNVRLHRFAPADGIARKQQEAAERGDLVKLCCPIIPAHVDAVFLGQQRHHIAAIAFAIALHAANFVKERGQNTRVRIAHTGECIRRVGFDVPLDPGLARLNRPFVQAAGGIMDVAVEKRAMIRIIHDLANRRTGAFRHHAVDHAFAFRHPGAGKPHETSAFCALCRPQWTGRNIRP